MIQKYHRRQAELLFALSKAAADPQKAAALLELAANHVELDSEVPSNNGDMRTPAAASKIGAPSDNAAATSSMIILREAPSLSP